MELSTDLISTAIATLAVILSQFRPLYTYRDRPKLDADLHTNLQITQFLGDLFLTPYIQIRNDGRAQGVISNIDLTLKKKHNDEYSKKMPAQTYFLKPETVAPGQSVTAVPMGRIAINNGESWESYVQCYSNPSPARRLDVTSIQQKALRETQEPTSSLTSSGYLSEQLCTEINHLTEDTLRGFDMGEYYLIARFWTTGAKAPVIAKCYSFSVYEGDILQLKFVTERFRRGEFLVRPQAGVAGFQCQLSEVEDERTVRKLIKPMG